MSMSIMQYTTPSYPSGIIGGRMLSILGSIPTVFNIAKRILRGTRQSILSRAEEETATADLEIARAKSELAKQELRKQKAIDTQLEIEEIQAETEFLKRKSAYYDAKARADVERNSFHESKSKLDSIKRKRKRNLQTGSSKRQRT